MQFRCRACRLFAGLVLLLLPSWMTPATAEPVTLAFAWPEGLAGTARFTARRTRDANGRQQQILVQGSYDFASRPVADGQLISFGKTAVDVRIEPPVAGMQGRLQQFLLSAANRRPSFVVNHNGHYLRLEGLDGYRRDLRQAYAQLLADLPDQMKQRVQQTIEATMSNQQVEVRMMRSWERDVGAWTGARLDQGETYEQEYSSPIPMLGNTAVPMKAAYRYLGPVTCGPAAGAVRCAHLEMRTFVDSDKLAAALDAFVKRMAGQGAADFKVEKLQLDTTVRLVTEPDTLVPHRIEQRKVSDAVMSQGGQSRASRQVEEMVYEFTYTAH